VVKGKVTTSITTTAYIVRLFFIKLLLVLRPSYYLAAVLLTPVFTYLLIYIKSLLIMFLKALI